MALGGVSKRLFRSAAYTVCAVHFVTTYAVDVTLTKGPSMSPVISERGSVVLYVLPPLLRLVRGSANPLYREGDIVISVSPTDARRRICKRVCATELAKNHHQSRPVVSRGHLWIEGDNKSNSLDSRHYGAISSHMLLGRVFLVISLERGAEIV